MPAVAKKKAPRIQEPRVAFTIKLSKESVERIEKEAKPMKARAFLREFIEKRFR